LYTDFKIKHISLQNKSTAPPSKNTPSGTPKATYLHTQTPTPRPLTFYLSNHPPLNPIPPSKSLQHSHKTKFHPFILITIPPNLPNPQQNPHIRPQPYLKSPQSPHLKQNLPLYPFTISHPQSKLPTSPYTSSPQAFPTQIPNPHSIPTYTPLSYPYSPLTQVKPTPQPLPGVLSTNLGSNIPIPIP
jgi:hypothetical protein